MYLIFITNAGALLSQLLLGRIDEQAMFTSLLLTQSFTAFAIQMFGIGSAAMFYVSALPLFFILVLNRIVANDGRVFLWAYALGLVAPLLTSSVLIVTITEVFVPLVREFDHQYDLSQFDTFFYIDRPNRSRRSSRSHRCVDSVAYWRSGSGGRIAIFSPIWPTRTCARCRFM
jgi:hypothetical protein